MNKKKKIILLLLLLLISFNLRVYAKEDIPENLDKEWYCNIVKGNAINNYFKLPTIKDGLKIVREDFETNADFEDAVDYYNLENYRITLNFKAKNKVDIGWTSLLYNDNYKDSQNVTKNYTYVLNGNEGIFTTKDETYPFTLANGAISVPSQNVVCYSNLIEAQKNYKLYELNENFDKSVADDNGFVVNNGILTKYIGTNRKLIFPSTVTEVAKFDSDNVYYFSSLVIPSSVQKIDDEAFEYLNTNEVVFSEGVKEIGNGVFMDASYADIYLPSSLIKIGTKAFGSNLSEKPTFHVIKNSYAENYLRTNYAQDEINIDYDYSNSANIIKDCEDYINYSSKEIKSFLNSEGFAIRNNILYACSKKSSDVRIPDNITTIASEAFSDYYNSKAKRIIVPSSVKKIEYNAFAFSTVKTIVFAEGLEQIESQAFTDTKLKDVYLPSTIKKIGKNIFSTDDELNGTIFHVEKDSAIAKYLENNSLKGKYEIKYDYEKCQELINNPSKEKFKIIIVLVIIISIIAIIVLINVLKGAKEESKKRKILERKRDQRLKSLNENIVTTDEVSLAEKSKENVKLENQEASLETVASTPNINVENANSVNNMLEVTSEEAKASESEKVINEVENTQDLAAYDNKLDTSNIQPIYTIKNESTPKDKDIKDKPVESDLEPSEAPMTNVETPFASQFSKEIEVEPNTKVTEPSIESSKDNSINVESNEEVEPVQSKTEPVEDEEFDFKSLDEIKDIFSTKEKETPKVEMEQNIQNEIENDDIKRGSESNTELEQKPYSQLADENELDFDTTRPIFTIQPKVGSENEDFQTDNNDLSKNIDESQENDQPIFSVREDDEII